MSQVKFSGPYSQDSGSKCRKFQVPGTQFKVLGAKVPGLRVPGSRFSGSQGSRSHGPWYRFSGPDFRLCHSAEQLETGDFCFDNQFLLKTVGGFIVIRAIIFSMCNWSIVHSLQISPANARS